MSIPPGTRLGSYEITDLIGQGGMGEVYRARDTRLQRDTAIKVLPDVFARDPDRLSRFKREALVLASLNHPGIAQIHGLEDCDGVPALVMELVEGPTLADRIAQGPMPVNEAFAIAVQIAAALEVAHDQGVVHRDLKPANVKVRDDGLVKLLDFGLAKALAPDTGSGGVDPANSPTLTSPTLSHQGVILGTAAYMSPEQARGRTVDRRADVWAFGCVLYEMLSGRRAFDGEDISMTLSMVLQREPDWSRLPPDLPAGALAFLKRSLEKDPRRRIRDIGDFRLALEGAFEAPTPASAGAPLPVPTGGRGMAALIGLAMGAVIAGLGAWLWLSRVESVPQPVTRFTLAMPDRVFTANTVVPFAITPDGRQIVFTVTEEGNLGVTRLFIRSLDRMDAQPIVDGESSVGSVFVSPDGQWIGYNLGVGSQSAFRKVRLAGGPAATLAQVAMGGYAGATWGRGGRIVYSINNGNDGLVGLSEGGGPPQTLTRPVNNDRHIHPFLLPGDTHVLFTRRVTGQPDKVAVLDIASGAVRDVIDGAWPRYLPTGHLLFARDEVILAVHFDARTGQPRGNPVPVLEGANPARLSFSENGTLVYAPGVATENVTLAWVDRQGTATPMPTGAEQYWQPRLSPDGRTLAVGIDQDIWTIDLQRNARTRLTSGETSGNYPYTWAPDGQAITVASPTSNRILQIPIDGRGKPVVLFEGPRLQWPTSWTPDGRTLAYYVSEVKTLRDLWMWRVGPPASSSLFVGTAFQERAARFSPDGRFVAYVSDESGRSEVYVRPYPGPGGQVALSVAGGTEPVWSRNGSELYFRSTSDLFVVDVQTSPAFRASAPRRLFGTEPFRLETGGVGGNAGYDVDRNGQRFIMIAGAPNSSEVRVVLNWFEELKRLVP